MRILIFLHGTLIMHSSGAYVDRDTRVEQVKNHDPEVHNYENYIPVGKANVKVNNWSSQGAEIIYLSSHKDYASVQKDQLVLNNYGFPKGEILYRSNDDTYAQIAEKVLPDVLIEDDCESIGGESEMTITNVSPEIKKRIKSIVVREFSGIDQLPDSIEELIKI